MWSGTATIVRFGTAAVTLKYVVAVTAANEPLAAWVAVRVTRPMPVIVRDVPDNTAGPVIDTVMAPGELDVTVTVMTALLSGWEGIGTKDSVGASGATVNLLRAVAEP